MKRYAEKFNELQEKYKTLHDALFILAQNIRADQPGGMSATTQYSKMLGVVYKSASYRAHSVLWHINELCNYHVQYEAQYLIDINRKNDTSGYYEMYLNYTFDDFVFNLMSLYDYFARYFYIAFVNKLKPKKTWRSLAKLCEDQKNEFYNCKLAEMIRNHNNVGSEN
ncbi:MAG: hypothetical protein D3914_06285 [Candidatus Electrothrix sp. LOE2]|nr:hypothetical protein [Candidatus Electrothrix sp. LOE2]